jgi:hypothetical protein
MRNDAMSPGEKLGVSRKHTAVICVDRQLMLGGNRPQRGTMDAVILPVSCCDTNASVRADI